MHLELRFRVEPTTAYPLGPDIDNLCQVAFGAVITDAGWFGGRRPNLYSYVASKGVADDAGVTVRIHSSAPDAAPTGTVLLEARYAGPLPRSARDAAMAAWAEEHATRSRRPDELLAITLEFAETVNIAEIATGPTKSAIDCLWPVLRGRPGAPDDGCVVALMVSKLPIPRGEISIRVETVAPEPPTWPRIGQ